MTLALSCSASRIPAEDQRKILYFVVSLLIELTRSTGHTVLMLEAPMMASSICMRAPTPEGIILHVEVRHFVTCTLPATIANVLADSNVTEDSAGDWVLHEPDPAHFFPPHLRREFLLDDGTTTLLGARDLDANYDEAIFLTMRNDTMVRRRAVKELLGLEKTWELQDPALRKAKRAVDFAS